MGTDKKYYIVEGDGPVRTAFENYRLGVEQFNDHVTELITNFKVDGVYIQGGRVIGIQYKGGNPHPYLYHKIGDPEDCYRPYKRTGAGKKAAVKLAAITKPDIHDLARWSGSDCVVVPHLPSPSRRALAWPTFEQIGEDLLWIVPIGTSGASSVEEPKPARTSLEGLREIKASEYMAMKETAK